MAILSAANRVSVPPARHRAVTADARDDTVGIEPLDLGLLVPKRSSYLRRSELTGILPHDVDLGTAAGESVRKGPESRVIPLRGRLVLEIEAYLLEPLPLLERTPGIGTRRRRGSWVPA
jgi:hypothetical protein